MNFLLYCTRKLISHALLVVGKALARYMQVLDEGDWVLTADQLQVLVECAIRHLVNSERAGIRLTPKHHMLVHFTTRSSW